jgi:hypothetical protein
MVARRQVCMCDREGRNRNVRQRNVVRDYEELWFDAIITFSHFQGAQGQNTYSLESWVNDSSHRSVGYGMRLGPT